MQTVLFNSTIFGPIHSRRLGSSLGINLSPRDGKICSFDCLYCEAGFNAQGPGTSGLPSRAEVQTLLRQKLTSLRAASAPLDVITFSGNGEPTLHPEFEPIVNDVITLRDQLYPSALISVLTNSTRLDSPNVCRALRRVDNNILKLDSAIDSTLRQLDRPASKTLTVNTLIPLLSQFSGTGIIQTMLLRGDGIDNTTPAEISALIQAYLAIRPRQIMLYSISRPTPSKTLRAIPPAELNALADQIRAATRLPLTVS